MPFLVHSIASIKLIVTFAGLGSCGAAEPVPGGERDHPTWPEGWQGSGQVPGEESYLHQLGCSTKIVQRRKKVWTCPLCPSPLLLCPRLFEVYVFRWTSRSWRTRWRIESRNMLLCNTLGTRRRSKSNLIHHHTLLFTQYLCWALLDSVPTKMQVCRRWPNFKSRLLAKYGVVSERMRSTLANVEDVPVDIRSFSHSHKYSLHSHKYSLHPHKYSINSHKYSEFLSSTFWCRMFSFGCLKLDNIQISIISIIFQAHLPKGLLEIDWALEWNKHRTVF